MNNEDLKISKRVALYSRVSTQEQASNGNSIDEQIERMKKYCEAMEWNVYELYTDAGFSGASTDRPALQTLIQDVKNKKVNKILVYKLDRLSRSQKDTLFLIEDVFLYNKCNFVSLSENFDTSNPFGMAMIGILAVFAQLEREQIKERMHIGKEARAKKGKFGGARYIPIGYDYIDGELVPNEFDKIQVIRIFEEYKNGKSPLKIANMLNDAGLTHKFGSWSEKTVKRLLSKKTYLGYISFNGEWYKGSHKPLIDEFLYKEVQKIREQKYFEYTKFNRRPGKVNSYLGGFIYCKNCGAKYFKLSKISNGNRYEYYSCNSRYRKGTIHAKSDVCKNKNWKMSDLDNLIFSEIKKLSADSNRIEKIKTNFVNDRPIMINTKIKELENQLERLIDLYSVGTIPLDALERKLCSLNAEKLKLESEISDIEKKQKKKVSLGETLRLVESFEKISKKGDLDKIHSAIGSLIEKIVVDEENITICWAFA